MDQEQIEKLGRDLQLSIEIDTTGWLREWAELRFILGPGRTLHPLKVRVGNTAELELRLRAFLEQCDRYNRCAGQVRKLRERCTILIADETESLDTRSPLMQSFQKLQNFEFDLKWRQERYMGSNVISPSVLTAEITHLESLLRDLESPVTEAEAEAEELQKLYEADTLDRALDA